MKTEDTNDEAPRCTYHAPGFPVCGRKIGEHSSPLIAHPFMPSLLERDLAKATEATFENTSDEQLIAFVRSRPPQHNVFAREVAEELANRLERLRTEYDEVRFNRKHTKDSPQHGDDITLCGRDCEGRA